MTLHLDVTFSSMWHRFPLVYKYLLTVKDSAKKETDLHICKTLPYFTNIFIRKKNFGVSNIYYARWTYCTWNPIHNNNILGKETGVSYRQKNAKCYASTIYMKTFGCHSRILQVFYYSVEARIFFFSFYTWKFVSFFSS